MIRLKRIRFLENAIKDVFSCSSSNSSKKDSILSLSFDLTKKKYTLLNCDIANLHKSATNQKHSHKKELHTPKKLNASTRKRKKSSRVSNSLNKNNYVIENKINMHVNRKMKFKACATKIINKKKQDLNTSTKVKNKILSLLSQNKTIIEKKSTIIYSDNEDILASDSDSDISEILHLYPRNKSGKCEVSIQTDENLEVNSYCNISGNDLVPANRIPIVIAKRIDLCFISDPYIRNLLSEKSPPKKLKTSSITVLKNISSDISLKNNLVEYRDNMAFNKSISRNKIENCTINLKRLSKKDIEKLGKTFKKKPGSDPNHIDKKVNLKQMLTPMVILKRIPPEIEQYFEHH